jgi:3-hydroxy-9,10-secoandrosta-1,3,5(10)-triene-9,17-dione monooxygenase
VPDVCEAERPEGSAQPISIPEPDLTAAEMIRRAEALRPLLRERQAETEAAGNMSADTNARLIEAGFYRVVQPRQFGGYEFDLPTYVKLMMAVARGCPETGWVLALTAGHLFQLASFPVRGQREIYGAAGEVRAPEVTAPPGIATRVPGGFKVSGAWDYASGCAHATHIIVVARIADDSEGRTLMALIDRKDYQIEHNWNVFGMQGTGSNRIILQDVLVPEYRTKPISFDGQRVLPDRDYFTNPLYFGPYRTYVLSESTSVLVGAAQGALDCYEEDYRNRKVMFPTNAYRYELAEFQYNFGRCHALINTARLALIQVAEQYMEAAQALYDGVPVDPHTERRLCLVQQETVHLAWQAVDIMFRTAGTSNARKSSMLGRYWRNISVLRGHLAHQSDTGAINFGRAWFGLETVGPG